MTLLEFFNPSDVRIYPVNRDDLKGFVEKHYLGSYPAAAKDYLGVFYKNIGMEALVGMVIYGSPSAPAVVKAMFKPEANVSFQAVSELKRLFLVDDETKLPKDEKKNLAGYCIAKGNDIIAERHPEVKAIVSYSDPEHHTGSVYKATNAIYQGRVSGKDRWVYPVGSPSQRSWVRKNLKTNIDWKMTTEAIDLLQEMWQDRSKVWL
jgi:hypothetical protein